MSTFIEPFIKIGNGSIPPQIGIKKAKLNTVVRPLSFHFRPEKEWKFQGRNSTYYAHYYYTYYSTYYKKLKALET